MIATTAPNVVITCHGLEAGQRTRHIEAHTWKQALQAAWPFPFCVILRGPEGGRPFLAARLDTDAESIVVEGGDSPEEARDNLRAEWAQHLKAYPCENVRRRLRPLLHLLKARGARVESRWDELVESITACQTFPQACAVLTEFLGRAAPMLTEGERRRAFWILEAVSFAPAPRLMA